MVTLMGGTDRFGGEQGEAPEPSESSEGPSQGNGGAPRRRRAKRGKAGRRASGGAGSPGSSPNSVAAQPQPRSGVAPRGGRATLGGPLADVLYKAGGRYRVRLAAFSGVSGPMPLSLLTPPRGGQAESLAECAAPAGCAGPREAASSTDSDLAEMRPRAAGHPADLIRAAAASGATSNPAFLDILDGGDFEPAPCLCCYYAETAKSARKAARELNLFQRYYSASSYLGSKAFPRMVQTLGRDLLPEELAAAKGHLSRLGQTTDLIRAVNAHPGICATVPPCRPSTVWVYATPTSRKMLRHLGRRFRSGGVPRGPWDPKGPQEPRGGSLSLSICVASSDPDYHPRWRYRMYSATLHRSGPEGRAPGEDPPGEKKEPGAWDPANTLLGAMREWVSEAMPPDALEAPRPLGRGARRGDHPLHNR